MPKYRIVYSAVKPVTPDEIVTIECVNPDLAVKAYVEAVLKRYNYITGAKVYPAEDKPLMEVGKVVTPVQPTISRAPVASKLFDGYTDKELTSIAGAAHKCCGGKKCSKPLPSPVGPVTDRFKTPNSTWINYVSWERKNSSLCVHFLRGGFIVYKSDWQTFTNFNLWVGAGGSPGEYYNANIKGLPVIKRS